MSSIKWSSDNPRYQVLRFVGHLADRRSLTKRRCAGVICRDEPTDDVSEANGSIPAGVCDLDIIIGNGGNMSPDPSKEFPRLTEQEWETMMAVYEQLPIPHQAALGDLTARGYITTGPIYQLTESGQDLLN